MNWVLALIIGLSVGWAMGLIIDYVYWQKRRLCTDYTTELEEQVAALSDVNQVLIENLQGAHREIAVLQTHVEGTVEASNESNEKKEEIPVDDLTQLWGIGPGIERMLNKHGIHTFIDLANTPLSRLREIIASLGARIQIAGTTSWPIQARLAADGKWDTLSHYCATLVDTRGNR